MSLIQQARTHYGDRFDEVLSHYIENGFVYIGTDAIVLAEEQSKANLFGKDYNLDKIDTWYIHYAIGTLARVFDICPFPHEWIVFEHHGEDRRKAYNFKRMMEITHGNEARTTKSTSRTSTSSHGS